MGAKASKSPDPLLHIRNKILNKPWREINWEDRESDLEYVEDYTPNIEGRQLRILLVGPAGAGKSSFINSVQSVIRGRMCTRAPVGNSGVSFTKKYATYKMERETPDSFYPFVFTDIMGLETNKCIQKKGVLLSDVGLVLMGRVKENYRFNPITELSKGDQFYNNDVKPNKRVHVLVCVIPANRVSKNVMWKIKEIRRWASQRDIPQVAIITKIDRLCPEIKEDLKNVYKSAYVKEKIRRFSKTVGIQKNCIFPVQNYADESNLNNDADTLILSALKRIIDFGEDFMNHKLKPVKPKSRKK